MAQDPPGRPPGPGPALLHVRNRVPRAAAEGAAGDRPRLLIRQRSERVRPREADRRTLGPDASGLPAGGDKRLRQAPPNGAAEVEEGLDALPSLLSGFGFLGAPLNIVYMFVRLSLGVLLGVPPGLGGANGVSILPY